MAGDDRVLSAGAGCRVPTSEVRWRFGPSGGPGGQHANRAHTRVRRLGLDDQGVSEDLSLRVGGRLARKTMRVAPNFWTWVRVRS